MLNYVPGMTLDPDRFQPYDPEAGGALETDGDLQTQVTVDFQNETSMGGIFRQVKGRAEIIWPATEHAFVIEGKSQFITTRRIKRSHIGPATAG